MAKTKKKKKKSQWQDVRDVKWYPTDGMFRSWVHMMPGTWQPLNSSNSVTDQIMTACSFLTWKMLQLLVQSKHSTKVSFFFNFSFKGENPHQKLQKFLKEGFIYRTILVWSFLICGLEVSYWWARLEFHFLFSCSVLSDSLWSHGLQHSRFLCPSPSPGACSNSCPLSRWCHLTIWSSVIPFCLQPFPTLGSFLMSQLFESGGQSTGASASASVLPMNIHDWFPLGLTGLISWQSKEVFFIHLKTCILIQVSITG